MWGNKIKLFDYCNSPQFLVDEPGGKGNVSDSLQSGIYHLDEMNAGIVSDEVISVQVPRVLPILVLNLARLDEVLYKKYWFTRVFLYQTNSCYYMYSCIFISMADPGFSRGGTPTPKLGLFSNFFAKNCMKIIEFGARGGGWGVVGGLRGGMGEACSWHPPLDPPMYLHG